MTEISQNSFKIVKARELNPGDVIQAKELDGGLVTIESIHFIAGNSAQLDHIGYSCTHGHSAIPADDPVSLLIP